MSAARIVGAGASVLIHAALLVTLPAAKPLSEPPKPVPVTKEHDSDIRLRSTTAGSDGLACAGVYRGIGAIVSWSGYVREVVSGGPADVAGLRVGDHFLNDSAFSRDFYPLETPKVLKVERDGQRLDLPVRIGRICFDKGPA